MIKTIILFCTLLILSGQGHPETLCEEGHGVLALELEILLSVGQLHNCHLEIIKREVENAVAYSVFVRDLMKCSYGSCENSVFELEVPKECYEKSFLAKGRVRVSIQHRVEDQLLRRYFQIEKNSIEQIMLMRVGEIDWKSGMRLREVTCRPDNLGGLHAI